MESAQNTTTGDKPPSKCSHCNTTSGPLSKCAKCKTAAYCNRECQAAHWSVHKKECKRLAALRNPPKRSDAKPFTALYHGNFLHDRSEEQTFKIPIDALRMRQEDMYTLEGDTMTGTIYNEERTSEKAFRSFLRRAKQVPGFFPPWWTGEKAEECVQFGLYDDDFSLAAAQEKSDIQETWSDNQMLMKLRMLAEKVYGNAPGGARGDAMLGMMMSAEGGQHSASVLDMASVLGGR